MTLWALQILLLINFELICPGIRTCMDAAQGVADIDKDIEAASLRALAAQSRLNSALISVYAKAPALPEEAAEGAAAAEVSVRSAAQNGEMTKPAGAPLVLQKGAVGAIAAVSAQPSDLSAPGQQSSVRQKETALQQGAAQKGAETQAAGNVPAEVAQGMSTLAAASRVMHTRAYSSNTEGLIWSFIVAGLNACVRLDMRIMTARIVQCSRQDACFLLTRSSVHKGVSREMNEIAMCCCRASSAEAVRQHRHSKREAAA